MTSRPSSVTSRPPAPCPSRRPPAGGALAARPGGPHRVRCPLKRGKLARAARGDFSRERGGAGKWRRRRQRLLWPGPRSLLRPKVRSPPRTPPPRSPQPLPSRALPTPRPGMRLPARRPGPPPQAHAPRWPGNREGTVREPGVPPPPPPGSRGGAGGPSAPAAPGVPGRAAREGPGRGDARAGRGGGVWGSRLSQELTSALAGGMPPWSMSPQLWRRSPPAGRTPW